MVHCAQNRSTTKYEVECVNAREAINLLARAEDDARRAELEEQSERKRRALRRTQEAVSEARRRAAEAEQQRIESEYLGQFESVPVERVLEGDLVLPMGAQPLQVPNDTAGAVEQPIGEDATLVGASDLDSVREELERRQN